MLTDVSNDNPFFTVSKYLTAFRSRQVEALSLFNSLVINVHRLLCESENLLGGS
jgi:hypothetical protein